MTPDRPHRRYTIEERRAIIQEARDTAAKLLKKLEDLARMEAADDALREGQDV